MAELPVPRVYSCFSCRNQVCLHDDIISKAFQLQLLTPKPLSLTSRPLQISSKRLSFEFPCIWLVRAFQDAACASAWDKREELHTWITDQGRHGRAFLFSHAMNVELGAKEDRQLMTGLHTVADVFCGDCRQVLGWKYVRAYESSQKYKEGKFIFEKSKIVNEEW